MGPVKGYGGSTYLIACASCHRGNTRVHIASGSVQDRLEGGGVVVCRHDERFILDLLVGIVGWDVSWSRIVIEYGEIERWKGNETGLICVLMGEMVKKARARQTR